MKNVGNQKQGLKLLRILKSVLNLKKLLFIYLIRTSVDSNDLFCQMVLLQYQPAGTNMMTMLTKQTFDPSHVTDDPELNIFSLHLLRG